MLITPFDYMLCWLAACATYPVHPSIRTYLEGFNTHLIPISSLDPRVLANRSSLFVRRYTFHLSQSAQWPDLAVRAHCVRSRH